MWLKSLSHLVFSSWEGTYTLQSVISQSSFWWAKQIKVFKSLIARLFFFQLRSHFCSSFLHCLHLFNIQHLIYLPSPSSQTVLLIISSRCGKLVFLKHSVCVCFLSQGCPLKDARSDIKPGLLVSGNHQFPKQWSCWSLHAHLSVPPVGTTFPGPCAVRLGSGETASLILNTCLKLPWGSMMSWRKHLAWCSFWFLLPVGWAFSAPSLKQRLSKGYGMGFAPKGLPLVSQSIHLMSFAWALRPLSPSNPIQSLDLDNKSQAALAPQIPALGSLWSCTV